MTAIYQLSSYLPYPLLPYVNGALGAAASTLLWTAPARGLLSALPSLFNLVHASQWVRRPTPLPFLLVLLSSPTPECRRRRRVFSGRASGCRGEGRWGCLRPPEGTAAAASPRRRRSAAPHRCRRSAGPRSHPNSRNGSGIGRRGSPWAPPRPRLESVEDAPEEHQEAAGRPRGRQGVGVPSPRPSPTASTQRTGERRCRCTPPLYIWFPLA